MTQYLLTSFVSVIFSFFCFILFFLRPKRCRSQISNLLSWTICLAQTSLPLPFTFIWKIWEGHGRILCPDSQRGADGTFRLRADFWANTSVCPSTFAEIPSEIGKKTANPDQVLASLTHAKSNTPAIINKMGWSLICSLEGSLYLVAGALCCLPR